MERSVRADLMSNATPSITDVRTRLPASGPSLSALCVQMIVLAGLTYWVFRVPITVAVYKWKHDGNWSHGWLVPVFSVYFLFVHRDRLAAADRKGSYVGLIVVLLSLAFFYFAGLKHTVYPQQLVLLPCLVGLVLLVWGWEVLRVAWFPIAYLIFAVPAPRWLFFEMTFPLRRIASLAGSALLGLLPDVYTQVQGVVIDYMHAGVPGSLNVEEACSGMRLMMAFCALGVAMAYLGDRPIWQRVIMVIACIPIAVFCNTLRVFTTGVFHVYGYKDLSQGTAHELVGLAMLPIALGLFALVGYVLKHLFIEEHTPEATA